MWLRTDSNPSRILRFRSYTGKLLTYNQTLHINNISLKERLHQNQRNTHEARNEQIPTQRPLSAQPPQYDKGQDVGGQLNAAAHDHVEVLVPVQVGYVVGDPVVAQVH